MHSKFLVIPGLDDSDKHHWQSLWEKEFSSFIRVRQRNYASPNCADWVQKINEEVAKLHDHEVYFVAHSLGCIAVSHWAQQNKINVKGALLVAPPDLSNPFLLKKIKGFTPLSDSMLPFKSVLVASINDPYARIGVSEELAQKWGSRFVNIGERGHVNSASQLGLWPEGLDLLENLVYENEITII